MARIRTIKPEIWESQKVGSLSVLARLTFIGLISLADDGGRGRGDTRYLYARLHPYAKDVKPPEVAAAISEIIRVGLAQFYVVNDAAYYQLPGFPAQQVINKPTPSSLPPLNESSGSTTVVLPEDSRRTTWGNGREGNGREGNGKEGNGSVAASPPRKLSPLQKVVNAYKLAKGVPKEDGAWDRSNFPRSAPYAKRILEAFDNSLERAVAFVLIQGREWTEAGLQDWTLAAIEEQAWNKRGTFGAGEIVNHDDKREPMGAARLLEQGRGTGDAPAGGGQLPTGPR